jgi:polysaccharide pyruvyl transferase WcaK-like protein
MIRHLTNVRAVAGLLRCGLARTRYRATRRTLAGYVGWLGHGNLGDEALFAALKAMFCEWTVVPFMDLSKETVLSRIGLSGKSFFDIGLVGGGTLVNPAFWVPISTLARAGVPLVMAGTGVGSCGYGQPEQVEITPWRDLAHRFIAVAVRGPLSLKELQRLGFTDVQVIGDPALSLVTQAPPPTRSSPRLVVSLAGAIPDPLMEEIALILRAFRVAGGDVIGVELGPGDTMRLRQLFARVDGKELPVVSIRWRPEAYFAVVREAVAVLAGRLHAGVLACCVGVPPILLASRAKFSDFAASMGLEGYVVPLGAAGPARIREVWDKIQTGGGHLRMLITERARYWCEVQRRFAFEVMRKMGAESPADCYARG